MQEEMESLKKEINEIKEVLKGMSKSWKEDLRN